MGIKDLIIKGIKRPYRIPSYLKNRMRYISTIYIKKRVSFTYEDVVSGWGEKGSGLPHFSARLYAEVKLLNEAIGSHHAKRSLEIGCGYGRLTPWIAEHSDQHYAIEPESVLLNDARKLYPISNIHFYQAKAQKLPFPKSYFDLCVSWTVLQHIPPKELDKAVTEIKRVCAQDAIIVLSEGVGKGDGKKYMRTWEYPLEKWKDLLSPWKLNLFKEQKIEETYKGYILFMRFERK